MKVYVSKRVINGAAPGVAVVVSGNWVVISHEDRREVDSDRDSGLFEVETSFFLEAHPEFSAALDTARNASLHVDEITGQVNINTNHKAAGFITDFSATASHQANLKVGWWAIVKGKPGYLKKTILITALMLTLCIFVSWLFLFYFFRIMVMAIIVIQSEYNGLLRGDLNPGIVVSAKPLRMAILTNLTKGYGTGEYPILRVVDLPLPKKYQKVGCKIPCAGSYNDIDTELNKPYWDFYDVQPLVNFTDIATIAMKRYEIPQYYWDDLYKSCEKLPDNPSIGFYTLRDRDNSWNEQDYLRFYDRKARTYGDDGTRTSADDPPRDIGQ